MRAHEAKTRALAMPYKDSDPSQQKSRKCVFRPFLNRHQKELFYSNFPLSFSGFEIFSRGQNAGSPKKFQLVFASVFCWYTWLNLQTIKVVIYCCLPTVIVWWKSGAQVFLPPLNRIKDSWTQKYGYTPPTHHHYTGTFVSALGSLGC